MYKRQADALRSAEKLSETGKTPKSLSPTPEGVGLPRAISVPSGSPKTVTEQEGGGGSFTINYYRKDSAFLSLEVPSPTPPC